MHKFQSVNQNKYLRFRRWSRNRFGAFYSLGKQVAIGQLKNSIADASLSKKPSLSLKESAIHLSGLPEYIPDDGLPPILQIINNLLMGAVLPVVSCEAPASLHTLFYSNIDASAAQCNSLRQMRFFIYQN